MSTCVPDRARFFDPSTAQLDAAPSLPKKTVYNPPELKGVILCSALF
jgi:hypothetical protein